jgi:pimeloyl-ACP methyl ester carboxylesterase
VSYPGGIAVVEHPPPDGWDSGPVVVLVHGSLDRGASFARTVRRLPDLGVVTYDRRGYHGSREAVPPGGDHARHVEDLLGVVAGLPAGHGSVVAVGHSVGGNVVLGAALADPARFAAVGAYEPPMPWLGFRRPRSPEPAATGGGFGRGGAGHGDDQADEVEQFFRRMMGDEAWERLPEPLRAARRADGPALAEDLRALRGPAPFDVTRLAVPAVFARGGSRSEPHHRQVVSWLVARVPGAELVEIEGAGHGAHLSHPDAFAAFVRTTAGRALSPSGGAGDSAVPDAAAEAR